MAIGNAPEIGVTFYQWGTMTRTQQDDWFTHIGTWGRSLQGGYGKICYITPVHAAKFQDLFGEYVVDTET